MQIASKILETCDVKIQWRTIKLQWKVRLIFLMSIVNKIMNAYCMRIIAYTCFNVSKLMKSLHNTIIGLVVTQSLRALSLRYRGVAHKCKIIIANPPFPAYDRVECRKFFSHLPRTRYCLKSLTHIKCFWEFMPLANADLSNAIIWCEYWI